MSFIMTAICEHCYERFQTDRYHPQSICPNCQSLQVSGQKQEIEQFARRIWIIWGRAWKLQEDLQNIQRVYPGLATYERFLALMRNLSIVVEDAQNFVSILRARNEQYQNRYDVPSWITSRVHWRCPRCSAELQHDRDTPGQSVVCLCGTTFLVHWVLGQAEATVELLEK